MRGKGTVLARVVANIVSGAAREGLGRDALLEAAGLRTVDFSDPDIRVPVWAEPALWQLIAQRVADPGVGVRIGAAIGVRQWGLLGYVTSYSATLGAALRRLVRYQHILNEQLQYRLEEAGAQHVAIGQYSSDLAGAGLPYATSCRVASFVGVCRQLTHTEVVPAEIAFTYDPPTSTFEYSRFFRCPLRFNQPQCKVAFAKRDLDLPIPGADETLAGYLSENAERVLRTLSVGTSTADRVRSAIWAALGDGRPTLRQIASALHVPPRTLQRHLAAEGTSLHHEVERVRKQMALATLCERTIPIEEVAFLLGYAESSTFYRSFKRWTGKTPHQYRTEACSSPETDAASQPARLLAQ
jgi:AraC-like DNA-binding protein